MKYNYLIFLLFLSFQLFSQSDKVQQKIDKKIKENTALMEKLPDQTLLNLRKLKTESFNANYSHGVINSTKLIIEILLRTKVDYHQILEETNLGLQIAKESHNFSAIIQFHQYRSAAYYNLGLIDFGFRELEDALSYTSKLTDINERNLKLAHLYGAMAPYYKFKKDAKNQALYLQKSLDKIKHVHDSSEFRLEKKRIIALQYADLAYLLNSQNKIDSAKFYFSKSYDLFNQYDLPIFDKTRLLLVMSRFYFNSKDYQKAIHLSHNGLHLRKENNHPVLKKEFYNILYKSYLETNQIDSSKYFSRLYHEAHENIQIVKDSTLNTTFEQHHKENESTNKHRIQKIVFIAVGTLTTATIGFAYWIRCTRKRMYHKYAAMLDPQKPLQESQTVEYITPKIAVVTKGTSNITDETLAFLLKKLEKFEKSNKFTKQDVTLSSIAHDLGTNSRYISQIIKEHRGKNFNAYINALRIGYIMLKLEDDPNFRKYKIAYLANYAGFSSGVVFATIFKKETGMTPSSYISQLEKKG